MEQPCAKSSSRRNQRRNMADSSEDRGQPDNLRRVPEDRARWQVDCPDLRGFPVRDWKTLADAGIVAPFGSPIPHPAT